MRMRRGNVAFSGKTLLAFALVVGGIAYVYLPMYWDYWAMRSIVKECAMEWKRSGNFYEDMIIRDMKRKEVSSDVDERACSHRARKDSLFVECFWTGVRYVPLLDKPITKEFRFSLSAELNGAVELN